MIIFPAVPLDSLGNAWLQSQHFSELKTLNMSANVVGLFSKISWVETWFKIVVWTNTFMPFLSWNPTKVREKDF